MKHLIMLLFLSNMVWAQDKFCHGPEFYSPLENLHLTEAPSDKIFKRLVKDNEALYVRDLTVAKFMDEDQWLASRSYINQPPGTNRILKKLSFDSMMNAKNGIIRMLGKVYVHSYYNYLFLKTEPAHLLACPDKKCLERLDELRDSWLGNDFTPDCDLDLVSKKAVKKEADRKWKNLLKFAEKSLHEGRYLPPQTIENNFPITRAHRITLSSRVSDSYVYEIYSPEFMLDGEFKKFSLTSNKDEICKAFGYKFPALQEAWSGFGEEWRRVFCQ